MVDFAKLLLATEITGARTYWHMTPPKANPDGNRTGSLSAGATIYNSGFMENYMVGNLGMTDVTSTTWFGKNPIYVHLINFLPVSAITSELFDKSKYASVSVFSPALTW